METDDSHPDVGETVRRGADEDRGIVPPELTGPPPDLTWVWFSRPASIDEIASCVGPGWRPLVAELVVDLVALGWDGRVVQVKQKFGELRFYIAQDAAISPDVSSHIAKRIKVSRAASVLTCDMCGDRGSIRAVSELSVRATCDRHVDVPNRDVPATVPGPQSTA